MATTIPIVTKCAQKWVLAGLVLTSISISLYSFRSRQYEPLSIPSSAPHVPADLKNSLLDLRTLSGERPSLDQNIDLHHLPDSDAFLPYFASIGQIQNLTITEAVGSCDFNEQELGSFAFDDDSWWKVNLRPDDEIAKAREEWQSFVQTGLISWSSVASRYEGRGIVIVGGHGKTLNRMKVSLRALRDFGSNLPVEIHYFKDELNEKAKRELREIYDRPDKTRIFFNDLSSKDQIWLPFYSPHKHVNFQLKTAGMINSRFAEILLLDSDNIPVYDPASLFETKTYKEYGTVFWPDHPRTRPEHPAWAITNTPCRRDEYEFESGQALVDKRKYFYHLQLTAWLNTQGYWQATILGDKDLFRFAWHALRTEFGRPKKWLTSIGFMAEQHDWGETRLKYCGHTFAQAHPDHDQHMVGSGIAFLHGGTLKTVTAPLAARLRSLRHGLFTHYKRVPVDILEDWSKIEYGVGLTSWDAGWYFNRTKWITPYELVGPLEDLNKDGQPIGKKGLKQLELTEEDMTSTVLCMDFGAVEARPLRDFGTEGDGFEKLFEESGGYWIIEDAYR